MTVYGGPWYTLVNAYCFWWSLMVTEVLWMPMVSDGLKGSKMVYEGLCGSIRFFEWLWWSPMFADGLWGSLKVYGGLWRSLMVLAGLLGYMRFNEGLWFLLRWWNSDNLKRLCIVSYQLLLVNKQLTLTGSVNGYYRLCHWKSWPIKLYLVSWNLVTPVPQTWKG